LKQESLQTRETLCKTTGLSGKKRKLHKIRIKFCVAYIRTAELKQEFAMATFMKGKKFCEEL
jgi:hypothetical protein